MGKAVTFDSGGLSIKPANGMMGMKFDMCGGAAVIEAIAALAELRAPVSVLGVVGATENMINGHSVRVGDIVTALDGTTIEVNNTDAEGRMVLADCIAHARREGCDMIVDIATLTGGVVAALGNAYAGLFCNDDALAQRVIVAPAKRRAGLAAAARSGLRRDDQEPHCPADEPARASRRPRERRRRVPAPLRRRRPVGAPRHGRRLRRPPLPYLDSGGSGWGARLLTEIALSPSA